MERQMVKGEEGKALEQAGESEVLIAAQDLHGGWGG